MQISQHTLDAAAKFHAIQEHLLTLPIDTTPLEELQEAVAAHRSALEAVAYATLDDIKGITRGDGPR